MQTEIIDKLFLELSQISNADTVLERRLKSIMCHVELTLLGPFSKRVGDARYPSGDCTVPKSSIDEAITILKKGMELTRKKILKSNQANAGDRQ